MAPLSNLPKCVPEPEKTELIHNDSGYLYRIQNIPSKMFEFFIHKRRTFKDGTCNWAIGVSPAADTSKGYTFEYFKGTEEEAKQRLDEIIKEYQ